MGATVKLDGEQITVAPLSIRLFGPMEVLVRGRPLPRLRSRKGLLLLAHLAVRANTWVDRSWLSGILWPESLDEQARASLRQTLVDLRRALGEEADRIEADGTRAVRLVVDRSDVDCLAFEDLVKREDRASLSAAMGLYLGELGQGLDDETLFQERQRHDLAAHEALEHLAQLESETGDHAAAAAWLRRLIGHSPLRESAVRSLMTSLGELGDYAAVTMAWRELRERTLEELRQEPSAETTACYRELREKAGQRVSRHEHSVPAPQSANLAPPGHPGRLPTPLTEMVGREGDVREISERLARSRLVTLTGTGGVGKTRLAICSAWEALDDYAGGVRFVELAGVNDPSHVGRAIAASLGVEEDRVTPLSVTLSNSIADRAALLVLDNCEHLLDSCARVASDLISQCPRLRVLCSSRQALGVTGEAVFHVVSLAVPEDDSVSAEDAIEYEGVRLFVERAMDAQPGFRMTDENTAEVVHICRQLDGIPLALELAAARMRPLTVGQISSRLDRRFELLTGGSRSALPRQQTLRALVDWSYDLLTDREKALFRAMSVFAGGWTEEAAQAVSGESDLVLLEELGSLVDKSLVILQPAAEGAPRYGMLETLRQYARQRLEESEEFSEYERRHAEWCVDFAKKQAKLMVGPSAASWYRDLDRERENIWAALERGTAGQIPLNTFARLVCALGDYWAASGRMVEATRWTEAAIEVLSDIEDPNFQCDVLNSGGIIASSLYDFEKAARYQSECLRIRREMRHTKGIAGALNNLANLHMATGNIDLAREMFLEALELNRGSGNLAWAAINLGNLGKLELISGNFEESKGHLTKCFELSKSLEFAINLVHANHYLGALHLRLGELDVADGFYSEAIRLAREGGNEHFVIPAFIGQAVIRWRMDEDSEGCRSMRTALELAESEQATESVSDAAEALAERASNLNQNSLAITFLAAASGLRRSIGLVSSDFERQMSERRLERMREAVLKTDFEEAWQKGESMEPELVVQLCRHSLIV